MTKFILCIIASLVIYLWDKIPQWKEERARNDLQEVERWYHYAKVMVLTGGPIRYNQSLVDKGYIIFTYRDNKRLIITPVGEIEL